MTTAALQQQFNEVAGIPPDARPLIENDVIRSVGEHRIHQINGVDYISAGTVLKLSPFKSDPDISPALMEWLRRRGVMVGQLCRWETEGVLEQYEYDPRLQPFVDAWRNFCHDRQFTVAPEWTEYLCMDEPTRTFGYCDFAGNDPDGFLLVEIKTAADCWISHRLQTCAYTHARRIVVNLGSNGKYTATAGRDEDFPIYANLAAYAHLALAEREQMAARRKEREREYRRAYARKKAAA